MPGSENMSPAFDAVLLIAFGGPQGLADIRPFLANVVQGRRILPERLEEVARHYELFGGVSPINRVTVAQAAGLAQRLRQRDLDLPVYVGMRNWHPLLADTLAEMSQAGIRRAVGIIAAPHQSYSSCEQYRRNVANARRALAARGLPDVDVTYAGSWHDRAGFIDAHARHVRAALERLPPEHRGHARVLFTAHSIPLEMARTSRYAEQVITSCRLVAERLDLDDWALVYQSRSGPPDEPWLGPDIADYLREQAGRGLRAVVVSPIGFLCDHLEVLYDLDHAAAALCSELGVHLARAATVNDDPAFLDTLAEVVQETCRRHQRFPPLPIAPP